MNATDRDPEPLSALLKRCRTRIVFEQPSLGAFLRLPIRIGKPVSQEELAEAAGITRQWYATMESGHPVRVSENVLARVADALMMSPAERVALFRLAVPELRSTSLAQSSTAILDAIGSFRHLAHRLWTAATEAEALMFAREFATSQIAPDAVVTCTRGKDGQWDDVAIPDSERINRLHALICERCPPRAIDDFHCYPFLVQPGELMSGSERDALFPDIAALHKAFEEVGWANVSYTMANVRSQKGFVALLSLIYHTPHAYSEIECAQLSALADLVSLAVTGCVAGGRTNN